MWIADIEYKSHCLMALESREMEDRMFTGTVSATAGAMLYMIALKSILKTGRIFFSTVLSLLSVSVLLYPFFI